MGKNGTTTHSVDVKHSSVDAGEFVWIELHVGFDDVGRLCDNRGHAASYDARGEVEQGTLCTKHTNTV